MKSLLARAIALSVLLLPAYAQDTKPPMRLAVAGLVHGHVDGFLLHPVQKRADIQIVGIYEPDVALQQKYKGKYKLAPALFFTNLNTMLDRVKPDAVAAFTNTGDHTTVVEACAPRHIPVMMEKPLAISNEQARRIQAAAQRYGIPVMVNYETTWYASNAAIYSQIKVPRAGGEIRKMVAMDGHSGPKEIGVGPEFLNWLSDPQKNGAGALFDFGCYGANLMTWLMGDQRPVAVTAVTQHYKPAVYPRVEDEATVLVEYPHAQGIIQASWDWPFSRKDFEVYTEHAYAVAKGGDSLQIRMPGGNEQAHPLQPRPADEGDSLSYLLSVVRGARKPSGLSSLENNLVVVEILDAARESARTGKRVVLAGRSVVR